MTQPSRQRLTVFSPQNSTEMSQNRGGRVWGGLHVQERLRQVCRNENNSYRGGAVG